MNAFFEGVITIALAIVGLGIIAVLVSKRANTAAVLQAGASGFGNDLLAAEAPVLGGSVSPSLGYPTGNSSNYLFGS